MTKDDTPKSGAPCRQHPKRRVLPRELPPDDPIYTRGFFVGHRGISINLPAEEPPSDDDREEER